MPLPSFCLYCQLLLLQPGWTRAWLDPTGTNKFLSTL